jgi:hypothetical protein
MTGSRALPLLAAALLLLVAAPTAFAGTEDDPDVVDPADKQDPAADLRSAWLEHDARGIRFTVKVTSAGAQLRDHLYFVAFRARGESVFAAAGFTGAGDLRGYLGSPTDASWGRGGFETVANGGLLDVGFLPGTPAYVTAVVPWGSVEGLEPGVTVVDIRAGTTLYHRAAFAQWQGGYWEGGHDSARSDRVLVIEAASVSPVDAWPWMATGAPVGGALAFGAAWPFRPRAPRP